MKAPNLDALAARGVNFRRGYCNNSVCMPSRATMVTGLTPRGRGFQTTDNVGGHVSYVFGRYRQWLDREHPGVHALY